MGFFYTIIGGMLIGAIFGDCDIHIDNWQFWVFMPILTFIWNAVRWAYEDRGMK